MYIIKENLNRRKMYDRIFEIYDDDTDEKIGVVFINNKKFDKVKIFNSIKNHVPNDMLETIKKEDVFLADFIFLSKLTNMIVSENVIYKLNGIESDCLEMFSVVNEITDVYRLN